MKIRPITPADNAAAAAVIREVMASYDAVGDGYSVEDPEMTDLAGSYSGERTRFYVVERNDGGIVGTGGVAPLRGGDTDVCELRKMYFLPEARGRGLGAALLRQLEDDARSCGYATIYLETVERMTLGTALYARAGFERLSARWGDTGHAQSGLFFSKSL